MIKAQAAVHEKPRKFESQGGLHKERDPVAGP